MPKFAANLSMMFNERPFLERFQAASDAGFGAVGEDILFLLWRQGIGLTRRLGMGGDRQRTADQETESQKGAITTHPRTSS